jgi:uncharacterized protein (DUF58 family)
MKLKKAAAALSAASLLILALALLTDGIVFYASFLAIAVVLAADMYRYVSLTSDIRRRLDVTRTLSRSEMLLGTALTITYRFDYHGRRITRLQCFQAGSRHLQVIEPSAWQYLRRGLWSLEYEVTPSCRGRHTVPGLVIRFETLLFRGSLTACGDEEINVYPVVDARPGRMSRGSLTGMAIGNEAIRQDAGIDFSHIRAYVPGDSTRNIDWARSGRYGVPVVKVFEEVRSRPVFILIDADISMETGTEKTELESAVELATLLSGRVLMENERIGIACFSGSDVTAYMPMASGPQQIARVRQLLASVRVMHGAREPRGGTSLLQDAIATQKAFGAATGNDGLSSVIEEAVRQFTANVKEDGFVRAVFRVSRSSGVPCHIIVCTNLSMGMPSLLDGARIARYYGHNVTVALTPHIWYETEESVDAPMSIDAEKYYRKYRETMETIACLQSHKIDVVELSAAERPEDTITTARSRRSMRMVR